MGSSRLPGKVLMDLGGEPALARLLRALKKVPGNYPCIVATSDKISDDTIEEFCRIRDIKFFRGSEENVMERVLFAAKKFELDIIVSITADCPLIDPEIVDLSIRSFLANSVDYVSNVIVRTYPDGMDVQVYKTESLEKSFSLAQKKSHFEHVTLHIRENPNLFSTINILAPLSCHWPDLAITLDEIDDLIMMNEILRLLGDKEASCQNIINLLKKFPSVFEINSSVKRTILDEG